MSTNYLPGESIRIGKAYFIRTCSHYSLGRVKHVGAGEIVLERASWIPNSGRWSTSLSEGPENLAEVEPYPGLCYIARQAIVDYTEWCHDLPTKQK